MDGLNSGMYYPSKFDEEKVMRLNEKRIAIETSEIYDDLSGEKGSFFENYYEEEKRGSDVDDLSANAIVEKALEGARVSRESEEGEAISNAIQNVIRDAEMQLQTFLEASQKLLRLRFSRSSKYSRSRPDRSSLPLSSSPKKTKTTPLKKSSIASRRL